MRFCTYCNEEYPGSYKFCPNCASRLLTPEEYKILKRENLEVIIVCKQKLI